MPRVTIKQLQEQINSLKSINDFQSSEINKLNKEINELRDKEKVVSIDEYNFLAKEFENQNMLTTEYRKMYENLKDKYSKERDKLIDKIKALQEQVDSSQIKLNERNAGRKAYSNKEVIKKIYELYLEGKSLQGIVDELNRLEIKTNRNKDWSKSSIRFILLNEKNVLNGFITEDIFNRTIKLLNDNKK
ncbi:hypothetical protein HBE96_18015 [Clostridium sp. P21]|uniref:Recombinase domain-containing protein n=1 Tax=Clostridium muellerianum TaxID=2716538 RepID=A0A7Y0EJ96_9CLOT|nr:recombinase family protein [Clostridium muellerianum]NMM64511.1 hypothetical protein [Clostridium muellerianum]